jgi:Uma2 family endonuclease
MPLTLKTDKKYTYKNYLEWSDDERWELIEGIAYNMTPAPSLRHQTIVMNFSYTLKNKLKDKPCVPFIAPTDVILSEHDVVQPDVIVVCDKKKFTDANIRGAPDLVIEVLSPATSLKDKREKKACYEKYGIREYIIVDPIENYVERIYLEEGGAYSKGDVFGPEEILPLTSLEGIEISLTEVFEMEEETEKEPAVG